MAFERKGLLDIYMHPLDNNDTLKYVGRACFEGEVTLKCLHEIRHSWQARINTNVKKFRKFRGKLSGWISVTVPGSTQKARAPSRSVRPRPALQSHATAASSCGEVDIARLWTVTHTRPVTGRVELQSENSQSNGTERRSRGGDGAKSSSQPDPAALRRAER